eukprot:jgi/Mesvir1/2461/Mv17796-RA.1
MSDQFRNGLLEMGGSLVAKLLSGDVSYAESVVVVHTLNGLFLRCNTFDETTLLASLLASEPLVAKLMELISSAEPHAYFALNLLQWGTFHPDVVRVLCAFKVIPFLFGLLRGEADYELNRAALSLVVGIGEGEEGRREVGRCKGACQVAVRYLGHESDECRELALKLVRILLRTKEGRRAACMSGGHSAQLSAVIGNLLQQDQLPADERRRLRGLDTELRIFAAAIARG